MFTNKKFEHKLNPVFPSSRLVRFDPLGHNLLTATVNPSNQQVRALDL